ncbi:hypothetical protein AAG570_002153 [Ranatra chinensis]|uniref:Uncharacterized protein n=1 Tax=Ranatra chinensis TaxID=642074 RepID=A0ABD0Y6N6_9HEMI
MLADPRSAALRPTYTDGKSVRMFYYNVLNHSQGFTKPLFVLRRDEIVAFSLRTSSSSTDYRTSLVGKEDTFVAAMSSNYPPVLERLAEKGVDVRAPEAEPLVVDRRRMDADAARSGSLVQCRTCHRWFLPARVMVHEDVCTVEFDVMFSDRYDELYARWSKTPYYQAVKRSLNVFPYPPSEKNHETSLADTDQEELCRQQVRRGGWNLETECHRTSSAEMALFRRLTTYNWREAHDDMITQIYALKTRVQNSLRTVIKNEGIKFKPKSTVVSGPGSETELELSPIPVQNSLRPEKSESSVKYKERKSFFKGPNKEAHAEDQGRTGGESFKDGNIHPLAQHDASGRNYRRRKDTHERKKKVVNSERYPEKTHTKRKEEMTISEFYLHIHRRGKRAQTKIEKPTRSEHKRMTEKEIVPTFPEGKSPLKNDESRRFQDQNLVELRGETYKNRPMRERKVKNKDEEMKDTAVGKQRENVKYGGNEGKHKRSRGPSRGSAQGEIDKYQIKPKGGQKPVEKYTKEGRRKEREGDSGSRAHREPNTNMGGPRTSVAEMRMRGVAREDSAIAHRKYEKRRSREDKGRGVKRQYGDTKNREPSESRQERGREHRSSWLEEGNQDRDRYLTSGKQKSREGESSLSSGFKSVQSNAEFYSESRTSDVSIEGDREKEINKGKSREERGGYGEETEKLNEDFLKEKPQYQTIHQEQPRGSTSRGSSESQQRSKSKRRNSSLNENNKERYERRFTYGKQKGLESESSWSQISTAQAQPGKSKGDRQRNGKEEPGDNREDAEKVQVYLLKERPQRQSVYLELNGKSNDATGSRRHSESRKPRGSASRGKTENVSGDDIGVNEKREISIKDVRRVSKLKSIMDGYNENLRESLSGHVLRELSSKRDADRIRKSSSRHSGLSRRTTPVSSASNTHVGLEGRPRRRESLKEKGGSKRKTQRDSYLSSGGHDSARRDSFFRRRRSEGADKAGNSDESLLDQTGTALPTGSATNSKSRGIRRDSLAQTKVKLSKSNKATRDSVDSFKSRHRFNDEPWKIMENNPMAYKLALEGGLAIDVFRRAAADARKHSHRKDRLTEPRRRYHKLSSKSAVSGSVGEEQSEKDTSVTEHTHRKASTSRRTEKTQRHRERGKRSSHTLDVSGNGGTEQNSTNQIGKEDKVNNLNGEQGSKLREGTTRSFSLMKSGEIDSNEKSKRKHPKNSRKSAEEVLAQKSRDNGVSRWRHTQRDTSREYRHSYGFKLKENPSNMDSSTQWKTRHKKTKDKRNKSGKERRDESRKGTVNTAKAVSQQPRDVSNSGKDYKEVKPILIRYRGKDRKHTAGDDTRQLPGLSTKGEVAHSVPEHHNSKEWRPSRGDVKSGGRRVTIQRHHVVIPPASEEEGRGRARGEL